MAGTTDGAEGEGGSLADPVPVLDLEPFLRAGADATAPTLAALCASVAACLHRTGCLVVRDPRVAPSDSSAFLDMMEQYFSRHASEKQADARPELAYQVGMTPSGVEMPRCLVDGQLQAQAAALPEGHRPIMPQGPDVKERFFWRVGPRRESSQYPELNSDPVVPQGFPHWRATMDAWGERMLATVQAVAALAAVGLGLPQDALVRRMQGGPHLLAPTGSDLAQHGQLGAVLAGYHSDLNLLTIHSKSRFPGLFVWLRDGRRVPVRIPDGCLLLQAGQQLEWLTGGYIKAGMHEVVVTAETQAAVRAAAAAARPLWRVSSTVFAHVASDELLEPLGRLGDGEREACRYPPITAGEQVRRELEVLKLRRLSKDSRVQLPDDLG